MSKKPKVCVSLVSKNFNQFKKEIQLYKKYSFSILEWRMDYFNDFFHFKEALEFLFSSFSCPILLTFRTKKEGGQQEMTRQDYICLYKYCIQHYPNCWIDLEYFMDCSEIITLAHQNRCRIVLSYHNFQKTPEKAELDILLKKMHQQRPDLCKIACMPHNKEDVLAVLLSGYDCHFPVVTISMGELGKISRLIGGFFGSEWTFASIQEKSAPGQIECTQLNAFIHLLY